VTWAMRCCAGRRIRPALSAWPNRRPSKRRAPTVALEKLRSAMAGEAEPLRAFGVNINAARIQAEALRLGLVKASVDMAKVQTLTVRLEKAQAKAAEAMKKHGKESLQYREAAARVAAIEAQLEKALKGKVPELDAAAKAQAIYSIIMKDTALAQGDFARTSDGLANSQRILRAELKDAAAVLGKELLPVALDLTKGAIQLVRAFKGLPGPVRKTIVVVGALAAAVGPILLTIGTIASGIGAVTSAVSGLAAAGGVISAVGGGLLTLLGPIGVVIAAGAGLYLAWKNNWLGIRDVTSKAWGWLKANMPATAQFLSTTWNTLTGGLRSTWEGATSAIEARAESWKASLSSKAESLRANLSSTLASASASARSTWQGMTSAIEARASTWRDAVTARVNELRANASAALANLRTNAINTATDMATQVIAAHVRLAQVGISQAEALRATMVAKAQAMKAGAVAAVQSLVDGVRGLLQSLVGAASGAGSGMVEAFKNAILGRLNDAYNAARALVDKIRALLPGSDAKVGPLRDLTKAGQALPITFAKGILSKADVVQAAIERVTMGAREPLTVGAPPVRPLPMPGPGGGGWGEVARKLDALAQTLERKRDVINVHVYNPQPMPAESEVVRRLRQLSTVGVL